jgi:hypothetical protein
MYATDGAAVSKSFATDCSWESSAPRGVTARGCWAWLAKAEPAAKSAAAHRRSPEIRIVE